MSGLSERLVRDWYSGSPWLWLLLPLALLFGVLTGLRRLAFRRGWLPSQKMPVPVIVVGNITVGGTGKTPLVAALVAQLRAAGYHPGIASRGYGGEPPSQPWTVTANTDVAQCGDEPLLLARRTAAPVVIDRDRVSACRALVEQHGCDVIVTDDGLQHYRLQRDIEIVVVDGERGLGNGHLLPMGPLREPRGRLRRADYVVLNGAASTPSSAALGGIEMTLAPARWVSLASAETVAVDSWSLSKRVHAIAGIGNPRRFFATLRGLGFEVSAHAFPDHHAYRAGDLDFGDDQPLLMTEKDAVKCQSLAQDKPWWYLAVDADLPAGFYQQLLQQLPAPTLTSEQEST